jgi:hypothetical protein
MQEKSDARVVRRLDRNALADLAQTEDETLLLTVVDVTLEIEHVVGREQVPSVRALDHARWWSWRALRRVAPVRDERGRRRCGRGLYALFTTHAQVVSDRHIRSLQQRTCARARLRPRGLSPESPGALGPASGS